MFADIVRLTNACIIIVGIDIDAVSTLSLTDCDAY